ncbi:MAG: hypothetical protein J6B23_07780, partial [Clostridia bacterium]|nr:hypothetical protein [Clostridia bacterium]
MKKQYLSTVICLLLSFIMLIQASASPLDGFITDYEPKIGTQTETEEGNKQAQNDVCISDETNKYIQPDPMLDEKYLNVFGDLQTKLMSDTSEIELVIVLESNKNYRITNTSPLDISFPIQSDDAFFSTAIYDAQNQLLTFSRSKSTSVTLSPSQYAIISTYSPVSVTYSTEDGLLFEENDAPALIKTTLERGKNYKLLNTADSDFTLTPENTSLYYEYISYNSDEIFKIGNIKQKGALNVLANGYNIITPLSSNSSDISFYLPAEITVEETSRRAYLYTDLTQDKNYKISNNTTEKITVRNPSKIIFDAVVYEGSSQTVQKAVKKDISLNPGSYMTISPTGSDMTVSFINDDNVCVEETNQNVFTRITPEYGKNYKITNTSSYQRKVYKSDSSTAIDYVAYDYSGKTDNVQYMKTSTSISVPSNGYVVVTLSAEKVCQLYFPESGDLTYEETAEPPLTFATLSYGTNYKISASAKTTIYKPTSSQALDMVAYNSAEEVENTYYNKQGGSLTVYANGYNVLTPHTSDVRIYYVSTDSVTIEEYDKAPLKIHTLSAGKTYKITNTTSSKLNLYKTDNNLGENSVVYYSDGTISSTYINRYSSTTTVVGNGYLIISPVESNETDMTVYYVNNGSFLFEEAETSPLRFSALEAGKSYKIINNSSSEFDVKVISTNPKFDAVYYAGNNSATSTYQGTSISTISLKANYYAIVAPSAQNQNTMDICYANDGSITIEEVDFFPLTYTHLEPGKSYKITNSTNEIRTMRFTNSSSDGNMNCDAAVYTNNGNYYTGRPGVTSSVELNSGYYAVFTVNSLALSALEMYYITSDVKIEEQSAPAFSKITLGKDDSAIVVNTSSRDCSVSMTGSYKKGYTIAELKKSGDIYHQEYERSASGYTVKTGNKALIFNPNSDAEITVCAPYTEFSLSDGADELSSFAVKPGETYMLPYPGDVTLYTSKSATLYDFIDFDSNNKVKRTIAGVYSYIDIRNDSSYITALRTNTSDLMLYYFKDAGTLRFEKTESVTELNKENVLCSWQGEYLGSYSDGWGSTFDVMRNKIIKITECTEDGDIKGVAYIDKHPVATDYVTLAYNFSGRINFATGQITYQGAGEPIYNLTNANFNYLLFTGHIDMANSVISGCANNEARRILSLNRVTKNNDAVTVEGINVTMINSGKEYDVLSETVEFYVGTAATPSFQINIDPNEDITPGYIAIRQNGTDVYYSIGNGSFPYVQMSKFAADEPIYVYVEDEYGRECANLKLTINIIRPVVESNEHRVSVQEKSSNNIFIERIRLDGTREPFADLEFKFNDNTYTTDSTGGAKVEFKSDFTQHISIEAEGYVPFDEYMYFLNQGDVITVYESGFDPNKMEPVITVLYTDNNNEKKAKNVFKENLGFMAASTGGGGNFCEIYVQGIDADEYYIRQGNKDLYKSTDGHFEDISFDGTAYYYKGPNVMDVNRFNDGWEYIFKTESAIYLRTVKNNKGAVYPTKIKVIDGTGGLYFVTPDNH